MRHILILTVLACLAIAAGARATTAPLPDFTATHDAGGLDLAEGIALAPDGAAVLVGTSHRSTGNDIVTVKMGTDGRTQWARDLHRGADDLGADAVVTPNGDVIAAGTITDPSGTHAILQKYTSTGTATWTTVFDKGTAETARALALDGAGNVYLTGVAMGSNGGDCFLAKFDASGQELWSKPVNLFWLDECFDVAADAKGNVVVAGRIVRDGSFDVLARKFDASGNELWTATVGTAAREEGRGVAIAPDGSVFVSGTTMNAAGTGTDIFVWRLDPATGHVGWNRTFDLAQDDDEGRGAVADAAGGVYVTGFGIVDGEKQSAILKLTATGEEAWRHVPGRDGIDGTGSIAVTPDGGRVVIAGAMQDTGADFDFLLVSYEPGHPIAGFLVLGSGHQANAPVTFQDTSTARDAAIALRLWDYGDGTTGTEPTHVYAKPGSYLVNLTVVDAYQTRSTASRSLVIAGAFVPDSPAATPEESSTPGLALAALLAGIAAAALARRR